MLKQDSNLGYAEMKDIYFVRHGESASNAQKISLGDTSPLTERGKMQSYVIAKYIRLLHAKLIVTSPYDRARGTANIIQRATGLPLEVSELFRERAWPSSFFGLSYENPWRVQIEGTMHQAYLNNDTDFRIGDEENFSDLYARSSQARSYLEERNEDVIIVVTHGTFLRFMHANLQFGSELTPALWLCMMRGHQTINTGVSHYRYHEMGDEVRGHAVWTLCSWMEAPTLFCDLTNM